LGWYVEQALYPVDPALRRAAKARLCQINNPSGVESALTELWAALSPDSALHFGIRSYVRGLTGFPALGTLLFSDVCGGYRQSSSWSANVLGLMPRSILPALAMSLVLAACGRPQQQQQMPPANVGYMVVKEQPVPLTVELPGRTNPFAVSEIRPQVSGIIQKRLFVEGSTVKQGQPLYQIDPAPYRAVYDSAMATWPPPRSRRNAMPAVVRERHRAPRSRRCPRLLSPGQGQCRRARINLGYTRIVASISGRIGASTVTEGALVTAQQATALTTLSTSTPSMLTVSQSSAELVALKRAIQAGNVSSTARSPRRFR